MNDYVLIFVCVWLPIFIGGFLLGGFVVTRLRDSEHTQTCDADYHNFVATYTNVDKSQTHTMTCTYCGKSISLVGGVA